MLKETGKGNLDEFGLEVYTMGTDEGMDSDEDEKADEENGQVGEIRCSSNSFGLVQCF